MQRLFVALDLPEAIRVRLGALGGGMPGARWLDPANFHLTLRFLGDVDRRTFRDLCDVLATVEAFPFPLTLKGVGQFPPRGAARTLWAGVARNPALAQLRDRVEAAVTQLDFAPEPRKFAPHITLARSRRGIAAGNVHDFITHHALFACEPFTVSAFHLFSSHLGSAGADYMIEATYPLGGGFEDIETFELGD